MSAFCYAKRFQSLSVPLLRPTLSYELVIFQTHFVSEKWMRFRHKFEGYHTHGPGALFGNYPLSRQAYVHHNISTAGLPSAGQRGSSSAKPLSGQQTAMHVLQNS
jgi:hypothetical protein